ncbi:hypothetical protein C8A00DRAFT_14989 [Chaetomidium leptoderma]|uniref:gamma-glutamylcyclotransferase n=1 Tax=Chaetomidium leptoderma TaxID=669021 RepID=A0AAN6ZYS1_9PEZI|nr:hypothetical protein C8A00DRAFT_14989 [Chaetomidium leptoderma]
MDAFGGSSATGTLPAQQPPVRRTQNGTPLHAREGEGVSSAKWYFAYGANMSPAVFLGRRQIQPLRTEVARIPRWGLCFNVLGIPYAEPGNGGLRRLDDDEVASERAAVHGIAYLLTADDLRRIVLSEGGGVGYKVTQLDGVVLKDGLTVPMNTLMGRHKLGRAGERLPSERYKNVLARAASEQGLPDWYQQRLENQPTFKPRDTRWYQLGVKLFLPFWIKMAILVEKAAHRLQTADGHAPAWFLAGFDVLFWIMWTYHDCIHSVIFGRGDGL